MISEKNFIQNELNPAASGRQGQMAAKALKFFALIFVLTIPFWVVGALTQAQILPALPISALAVVCPVGAASILIYRERGGRGVIGLLKRSFDFKRVQAKVWYVSTILLMPAIMILSYIVLRWIGAAVPAPQFSAITVLVLFIVFFISAFCEELGWAGYITEPLQNSFGALRAALLIGIIWAVWHIIPLLSVQRSLTFIAWWALGTVAYRVIITWLYDKTGRSVFIAALFHAMVNLTWQLFPVNGSYYDPGITAPIAAVVAILMVIIWKPNTLVHSRFEPID